MCDTLKMLLKIFFSLHKHILPVSKNGKHVKYQRFYEANIVLLLGGERQL